MCVPLCKAPERNIQLHITITVTHGTEHSDLNSEVTVVMGLMSNYFYDGESFVTEKGDHTSELMIDGHSTAFYQVDTGTR